MLVVGLVQLARPVAVGRRADGALDLAGYSQPFRLNQV